MKRKPHGVIDEAVRARILALRTEGLKAAAIGAACNLSESAVYGVMADLRAMGIAVPKLPPGPPPPAPTPSGWRVSQAEAMDWLARRRAGAGLKEIADATGRTKQTVHNVLKRLRAAGHDVPRVRIGRPPVTAAPVFTLVEPPCHQAEEPAPPPLSARVVAGMARVQRQLQREADRLNAHWATRGVRANARVENFQLVSDLGQHFARRRAG